jgi:hypothetical protein
MKYNNETLVDYCNENNISLIKPCENDKINRESYLDFTPLKI